MLRRHAAILLTVCVATMAQAKPLRPDRIDNLEALYEGLAPSVVTVEVLGEQGPGNGSGVVLHKDGFIATAAHVVESAALIRVEFYDGTAKPAEIVTLSRTEDLALLKVDWIPANTFIPKLADSEELAVGQPAFCIGAPLGLKHTLTTGIVSSIRRNFGDALSLFPKSVIQTDAAINQGNSGGALFNAEGHVIGIASFMASPGGGSIGLGFAVPSNVVRRRLFEDAIPYIGVSLRRIPLPLAEALNWPVHDALLVEKVRPGSPAAAAGLRGGTIQADIGGIKLLMGGDLIVKVADFDPTQAKEIHAFLHGLEDGSEIPYTIVRAGELGNVTVVIPKVIQIPKLEPLDPTSKKKKAKR